MYIILQIKIFLITNPSIELFLQDYYIGEFNVVARCYNWSQSSVFKRILKLYLENAYTALFCVKGSGG